MFQRLQLERHPLRVARSHERRPPLMWWGERPECWDVRARWEEYAATCEIVSGAPSRFTRTGTERKSGSKKKGLGTPETSATGQPEAVPGTARWGRQHPPSPQRPPCPSNLGALPAVLQGGP
jgi:hypothetical protein